jgi:hypothetical protein
MGGQIKQFRSWRTALPDGKISYPVPLPCGSAPIAYWFFYDSEYRVTSAGAYPLLINTVLFPTCVTPAQVNVKTVVLISTGVPTFQVEYEENYLLLMTSGQTRPWSLLSL